MFGSRKKAKFRNHNFPTTTTMPLTQLSIRLVDPKKLGLRKDPAKFEKENVEEVDGGR